MKARVLAPVSFAAGTRLFLSEEQARLRSHAAKLLSGGLYLTTAVVQFKAGEIIGIEGDLPKAMEALVETEAKAARRKRVTAVSVPVAAPPAPSGAD